MALSTILAPAVNELVGQATGSPPANPLTSGPFGGGANAQTPLWANIASFINSAYSTPGVGPVPASPPPGGSGVQPQSAASGKVSAPSPSAPAQAGPPAAPTVAAPQPAVPSLAQLTQNAAPPQMQQTQDFWQAITSVLMQSAMMPNASALAVLPQLGVSA